MSPYTDYVAYGPHSFKLTSNPQNKGLIYNKDYTMSKTITEYHISYIVCFHFNFVFCIYENLDLKIVFIGLNPIAIVYIILWMHRIYRAS